MAAAQGAMAMGLLEDSHPRHVVKLRSAAFLSIEANPSPSLHFKEFSRRRRSIPIKGSPSNLPAGGACFCRSGPGRSHGSPEDAPWLLGAPRSLRRSFLAWAAASERLPSQVYAGGFETKECGGGEWKTSQEHSRNKKASRPSLENEEPMQSSWTRRMVLAGLSLGAAAPPALAASNTEPSFGTQITRTLGIGDADIYYPDFFEGTWDCFSTLIAVDTPQGEEMADLRSVDSARKQLGYAMQYKARFVPYRGQIIGDRLFTTRSLVESTVGRDIIASGEWDPGRPSRLSLTIRGGTKVENLVTKRSFDMSAPGQFDTFEYSKQVFESGRELDGPPSVKASGNLTRYRWDASAKQINEIEAFQRISMFPVVGGAASNKPEGLSLMDVMVLGDKPVTVYKYVVRFTRA